MMSGITIKQEPTSTVDSPVAGIELQLERKSSEGRKYAIIDTHSVKAIADSFGIAGLNTEIASMISQEVSYRLNQIINNCSLFLRQSKRKLLLSSDLDQVFMDIHIPHVLGHITDLPAPYLYLQDVDMFIPEKPYVDLYQRVYQAERLAQKGEPFIRRTFVSPNIEVLKTLPAIHIKKEPNSAEESMQSLNIPTHLQNYYHQITCVILCKDEKFLKLVLTDLKINSKIGPLIECILNTLCIALDRAPSRRYQLLSAIEALVDNPYTNVMSSSSPVHRLIDSLLTCAMEPVKMEGSTMKDDYTLKDRVAYILGLVVNEWCTQESKLKLTIIQKLGSVIFNGTSSLLAHYGALMSLVALGNQALDFCLWPHLEQYLSFLESNPQHWDVKEIEGAILNAVEMVYRRELSTINEQSTLSQGIVVLGGMLSDYFGDALCVRCPCHQVETFESRTEKKNESNKDFDVEPIKSKRRKNFRYRFDGRKQNPVIKKTNSLCELFDLPDAKKRTIDAIQMNFAGGKPVSKQQLLRRCAGNQSPTKAPSVYYRKSCQVDYIGKSTASLQSLRQTASIADGFLLNSL